MIELRNLTYIYNKGSKTEKVAVDNVSLSIPDGEMIGVIGHTGSGKSTLITHLNGLLKPTSGKVIIDGEDMWANEKEIRKFRFKTGLVFQYPEYQLFEATCYDDIAYGPKNIGLNKSEIDDRVKMAAEFVGLKQEILNKSPFDLSGGQKRRVAIAGVIAMNPEVLVLDEPTAGLDPNGRDMILSQIKKYQEKSKKTVILVSHSMEDIAKFAKKVIVMNNGKIFMFDEVEKVFKNAKALENINLDMPQITKIFNYLAQKGYDVPTGVFNVEDGFKILKGLIKK
ncbi:MAG: energy-coupling factor transporter ATPase [Oscillospiraceae bacterium]